MARFSPSSSCVPPGATGRGGSNLRSFILLPPTRASCWLDVCAVSAPFMVLHFPVAVVANTRTRRAASRRYRDLRALDAARRKQGTVIPGKPPSFRPRVTLRAHCARLSWRPCRRTQVVVGNDSSSVRRSAKAIHARRAGEWSISPAYRRPCPGEGGVCASHAADGRTDSRLVGTWTRRRRVPEGALQARYFRERGDDMVIAAQMIGVRGSSGAACLRSRPETASAALTLCATRPCWRRANH